MEIKWLCRESMSDGIKILEQDKDLSENTLVKDEADEVLKIDWDRDIQMSDWNLLLDEDHDDD
jgi:hypothetical protein